MEVSYNFVDANSAFDSASLLALGIEMFGVVFALTLLDAFTAAKGP
jgi:hypothetical protein